MHNNFYISILISSQIYFIRSPCRERTHGGLASLRPFFPVIRPISRDWSFRVASTGAAARWYPSKSGTGREFLGCVVRGVSRRDRGTEGRSCLDVGVDALIHVVIASFPPLSFSSFDPSSCRETTFWSVPFPSRGSKKTKVRLDTSPLENRFVAKVGANGVARAWVCQWRRCVDRFSRGRVRVWIREEAKVSGYGPSVLIVCAASAGQLKAIRSGAHRWKKGIIFQNISPRRTRNGPKRGELFECRLPSAL